MLLSQVLHQVTPVKPDSDPDITALVNDSRLAGKGSLYIAASGYTADAHPYIPAAYKNGCRAFLTETGRAAAFTAECPGALFIELDNLKNNVGQICRNFYHDPCLKMKIAGITGTSGKTTTAFAVYGALRTMGIKAGLIGTIEYRIGDTVIPATNTTPDVLSLYSLFHDMVKAGVEVCVMEISSHALSLGRVDGLDLDAAGFTNFSQDHLDFHNTMEEYFEAKLLIFGLLAASRKNSPVLLVNRETDRFNDIALKARAYPAVGFRTLSCAAGQAADYQASDIRLSAAGTAFALNGRAVNLSMVGMTNVYNFTMAAGLLALLGYSLEQALPHFQTVSVKGRMESVPGGSCAVIVDYAHKPDALSKVLQTLRGMLPAGNRVITVFGCGGDRDRSKRPVMGRIAGRLSEYVVITSDNPRTEDPMAIIAEIEAGVKETGQSYTVIENRAHAIETAIMEARAGDIVLIAGKGHEDYQIIGKVKHHFSDTEEASRALKLRKDQPC